MIWINRYNKEFHPLRITVSEISSSGDHPTLTRLTTEEADRASQNRELAREKLLKKRLAPVSQSNSSTLVASEGSSSGDQPTFSRLTTEEAKRATRNRSLAQEKLLKKKKLPLVQFNSTLNASEIPSSGDQPTLPRLTTEEASQNRVLAREKLLKKRLISLDQPISPTLTASETSISGEHIPFPRVTTVETTRAALNREEKNPISGSQNQPWMLLSAPGLALRNTLNKCWYHSSLHLLTASPLIQILCSSVPIHLNSFERSMCLALQSILNNQSYDAINDFFLLIRDFNGRNNRYGQAAVPDFLDYVCDNSPNISEVLTCTWQNILQCSRCKWVSTISCQDVSLKLYPSFEAHHLLLSDLVCSTSNITLSTDVSVFCGHCNVKTPHTSSREYNPDISLLRLFEQ